MPEAEVDELISREKALREAIKNRSDTGTLEKFAEQLYEKLSDVIPRKRFAGLRENFEVLVVAIAVAMAFRAYFLQPFKIPTGSMQKTLYGIHSEQRPDQSWTDQPPVRYLKWMIKGESYRQIKVDIPGVMSSPREHKYRPDLLLCSIGNKVYKIPKDAYLRRELSHYEGEYVPAGTILWSGIVTTGDHIFVDKVRWNFSKPKRGQVIVFRTSGIKGLMPDSHYIKRLVGMQGEIVTLAPPNILINGKVPEDTPILQTIEYYLPRSHTYNGNGIYLDKYGDTATIPDNEYFVLGDNSANSMDGRYWGTVPEENTVGPAALVYWPFSRRWGVIR